MRVSPTISIQAPVGPALRRELRGSSTIGLIARQTVASADVSRPQHGGMTARFMAGETGQAALNARSKSLHQIRPGSHKRPAEDDQFGVEVVDGVYDHRDEVAKNVVATRRLRGAAGEIKQLDQAVGQAAPPSGFQDAGNPDQNLHATALPHGRRGLFTFSVVRPISAAEWWRLR